MRLVGPAIVMGKDGLHGTVESTSRRLIGQPGQVVVRLDDGRQVLAPGDALVKRDDGVYYLPLSLADLEAHQATGAAAERVVVPLLEEQLKIAKRKVETGRVRVHKRVREREEVVDEPLLQEDVEIERVPVNRPVEGVVQVRYEGDTIIIPLLEEVLVVEKRLILREELRITKRHTEIREVQRVMLRVEEGDIERLPGTAASADGTAPAAERLAGEEPAGSAG